MRVGFCTPAAMQSQPPRRRRLQRRRAEICLVLFFIWFDHRTVVWLVSCQSFSLSLSLWRGQLSLRSHPSRSCGAGQQIGGQCSLPGVMSASPQILWIVVWPASGYIWTGSQLHFCSPTPYTQCRGGIWLRLRCDVLHKIWGTFRSESIRPALSPRPQPSGEEDAPPSSSWERVWRNPNGALALSRLWFLPAIS